jgi:hypothetical protein
MFGFSSKNKIDISDTEKNKFRSLTGISLTNIYLKKLIG